MSLRDMLCVKKVFQCLAPIGRGEPARSALGPWTKR